jgi:CheY-like chemotaxis protein
MGSAAARPMPERVVLVVDDEEMVCHLAARILTEAGFRVVAAHDGSEALALLAAFEGQVQLVVSDIAMPGMTGVQLAQTVTTRWPALPLLLMSGQSPGPDYGGRFLPKPFTTDSLFETVAALVPAARH